MLRNVVEPIVGSANNFHHNSIPRGTKVYGAHLHPIPLPGVGKRFASPAACYRSETRCIIAAIDPTGGAAKLLQYAYDGRIEIALSEKLHYELESHPLGHGRGVRRHKPGRRRTDDAASAEAIAALEAAGTVVHRV